MAKFSVRIKYECEVTWDVSAPDIHKAIDSISNVGPQITSTDGGKKIMPRDVEYKILGIVPNSTIEITKDSKIFKFNIDTGELIDE